MADEETGSSAPTTRSAKSKCCGSPSRRFCSTLMILIIIIAIALVAFYATRTDAIGEDESHTLGTQGTCSAGVSADSSIKIMTFNIFQIYCIPGVGLNRFKCQEAEARTARAENIGEWFKDRDEDVVLLQEIWSNHDVIRDGMTAAGFCHYVMTEEKSGSGLAIFSKYPISENSFKGWFDVFGALKPDPLDPETYIATKGVLYAKVMKGNQSVHLVNYHTNSDSFGDKHDVRLKQFNIVKEVIDSKNITKEELVLIGGDANEDKECRLLNCDPGANCENQTYYNEMLTTLSADDLEISTDTTNAWTYNTENNTLLKSLYAESDCDTHQYLLDYIFVSQDHMAVKSSSVCEILNPLSAEGTDLSDHFPVTCVIDFEPAADNTEPVTEE
mmetsp:Transcript_15700/g.22328  ORF Transcript_15700/g.22328 Transcript_15700/m.22328 type:complete len:387 (+) Transcript_15700:108-1268(+)|eukprot:CAMPEP_0201697496 /NCGR_PEP_ID=MMETSP0578-20130828/11347_1 /ASSEMBLY_ACC=CAM_ASM_000663 /TAXON_ID=267565 /ORGANISM="Skeletonema grethea, Strain CCMP 1804" /LENGTH=386 /DNA_ID=CAMNT_0048183679 /DNA_START=101 /DNA_END=1261 /DNA_ORIENTATION=+